jgi:hypothetical protein
VAGRRFDYSYTGLANQVSIGKAGQNLFLTFLVEVDNQSLLIISHITLYPE